MKTYNLILLTFGLTFFATRHIYNVPEKECEPTPQTAVVSCKRNIPVARTESLTSSSSPLIESQDSEDKEEKSEDKEEKSEDKADSNKNTITNDDWWRASFYQEPEYMICPEIAEGTSDEGVEEIRKEVEECELACENVNPNIAMGAFLNIQRECCCKVNNPNDPKHYGVVKEDGVQWNYGVRLRDLRNPEDEENKK
jgi:hypothetical protein